MGTSGMGMPLGNVADILSGGERILILDFRVEFPVVCSLEQIPAHLLRGEAGAALVKYDCGAWSIIAIHLIELIEMPSAAKSVLRML